MIPKILHIVYVGTNKPFSPLQTKVIEAAHALHPHWEVRVWRDPVDTTGFRLLKYWPKKNSGAQLADLARLDIVNKFGGFYIDSDVILKRPLDHLSEYSDFVGCSEDGFVFSNGVFGATPYHPAIDAVISELEQREPDWSLPPNLTTGPALFTRILGGRSDVALVPRQTFYPYGENEAPVDGVRFTYGVHVWGNSTWSKKPLSGRLKAIVAKLRPSRLVNTLTANIATWSSRHIWISRFYEGGDQPHVTAFIRRALRGGDFVVDLSGVDPDRETMKAIVGPFGRVISDDFSRTYSRLPIRLVILGRGTSRSDLRTAEILIEEQAVQTVLVRAGLSDRLDVSALVRGSLPRHYAAARLTRGGRLLRAEADDALELNRIDALVLERGRGSAA